MNHSKVSRLFTGSYSTGQHCELAQSVTGEWYLREHGYNGYGMGWSKWMPYAQEVVVNDGFIEWGFSSLHEFTDTKVINRMRLPVAA